MKRLAVLFLLLFIAFTVYVLIDRYRTQRHIIQLERQLDGLFLSKELDEYRKAHPFK
jgi:hypothetical protein